MAHRFFLSSIAISFRFGTPSIAGNEKESYSPEPPKNAAQTKQSRLICKQIRPCCDGKALAPGHDHAVLTAGAVDQEKAGMTLGEYVEAMITEYYDWKDGKIMTGEMRTLAAQIPAELFDRLDRYLKERGIKKKDFLVDIITRALEEAEAAEPVTEASPQDELEEQPEADET